MPVFYESQRRHACVYAATVYVLPKKAKCHWTPRGLEPRLALIIVFMFVISSTPVVTLVNPPLIAAPSPSSDPDYSAMAPSTISQGGSDFTTQAPLLGPATFRSTDIVSSRAIYEIQFITTTTGVIDKIDITFPLGTVVAAAGIIERVGIGPGSLTKSGATVTLDVHTPVSIPAGTFIRLEMVDIGNPSLPANYKVSVTTRDPANVPIDGPSLSPAYTIRQVSTGMITDGAVTSGDIANSAVTEPRVSDGAITTPKVADGAITSTKPAESFMKRVTVLYNAAGNGVGWNPNDSTHTFTIIESALSFNRHNTFLNVEVHGILSEAQEGFTCFPTGQDEPGTFVIVCNEFIPEGYELHYVVGNLPEHVIS